MLLDALRRSDWLTLLLTHQSLQINDASLGFIELRHEESHKLAPLLVGTRELLKKLRTLAILFDAPFLQHMQLM